MNIFETIQLKKSGPACQNCIWFCNDPAHVEAAYPGLTALSSAYASIRDRDGFCQYHQLYLSGRDHCPNFKSE